MIDLFEHAQTRYYERADGNLVLGNVVALKEKGPIELIIGIERFLIPVDENGFWSWTPATPYTDGNYSLSVRQYDEAGNLSIPTLGVIIIDSTPPEAPDLLVLNDDQGNEKGAFLPGESTDDKRPTLTGIAQKGVTVYLRDADGNNIGSAIADKNTGKWQMEPAQDLKEGDNSLTLVAVETFAAKTRESAASAVFDIKVVSDGLPADSISISHAFDNQGSATGLLNSGALTDDTTPTLNGSVSAGSSVVVYYRLSGSGSWAGSATATVSGESWSWTSGSALTTGNYEFQASITQKQ